MAATAVAQAVLASAVVSKSSFVTGRSIRQVKTSVAPAKVAFTVRAERPNWFPGSTPPAYLDGSLPGDYGFDPLGLASDDDSLKWLVQAELVHCRWAMLGAAGILIPDALREAGILDIPNWIDAATAEYSISAPVLFAIEILLFAWAEGRRWIDIVNPGSVNQDPIFTNNSVSGTVGYPGFDPLGYSKGDAKSFRTYQAKEIANGRLAMLANLGFWVQYSYTGETPIKNLLEHVADPGHATFYGSLFN